MNHNFPNPHFLADVNWLQQNLEDHNLVILDARFDVRANADGSFSEIRGREDYEQGHVPGAQFVDLQADLANPDDPTAIIGPEGFSRLMSSLGVDETSCVVVYDARGGVWAARLWWALRYYGHEHVKMLDGGLVAWQAAGFALEAHSPPAKKTGGFVSRPQPHLRVVKEEVLAAITQENTCIIDALPTPFYRGLAGLYPEHRKGHIPGAHNVPAEANLDPATLRIRPMQELQELWAKPGIRPEQRVITYCGGGVFASFSLFVLALMGHENTALYDASWMEWGRDETLPVETGRNKP